MGEATRSVILRLLKELRSADALDLARRLGLSPAAIRYHLEKLRSDGSIESCPVEPGPSGARPGRPACRYRLPLKRAPDNLGGLCAALLHLHTARQPADWDALAAQMVDTPPHISALPQRLASAAARLNALNYQASWEAGPRGPRLRFHNCPYAAIWPLTPDLCRLDEAILSRLTASPARQVVRTRFGAEGPASCLFEIGEKHA